jgi:hypothetical protein
MNRLLGVALLLCSACRYHPTLSAQVSGAPREIVAACQLAESRCSRCHVIDRVTHAQIDSPQQWQYYVHRMRLQPGSAISDAEEPTLVRCLVYASFGDAGLQRLAPAPGAPAAVDDATPPGEPTTPAEPPPATAPAPGGKP